MTILGCDPLCGVSRIVTREESAAGSDASQQLGTPRRRAGWLLPLLWFSGLGLIVLGPLLSPGYLLLLDAPAGPHPSSPPLLPLPSDGLVSAATPVTVLVRLITWPWPGAENKALVLATIVVGGVGLYRFAARTLELSTVPSVAGATLFVINPFVYDRLLAGQLLLTLAYALLPWALPSFLSVSADPARRPALRATAWVAATAWVDLHIGGMAGLILVATVIVSPRSAVAKALLVATVIAWVGALHLFWILPSFLGQEAARLGSGDLRAYAPRPRSVEILAHVLALHGFWRTEFATPLARLPVQFLAGFGALVAAAVWGFLHALKHSWWRHAAGLAAAALVGTILGMGTSFPPTAWLTRFLFDRVPGYGIYREPQKWIALLALGYAVFAATGFEALRERLSRSPEWLRGALLLTPLLPLLAMPLMLWGFGGQVRTARFPEDWHAASRMVSGKPGRLLLLPWNLYQPLPFAGNRVIANLGPRFFPIPVLITGDAQLGRRGTTQDPDPRVSYVDRLLRNDFRLSRFGHLVAPLGVRYVALTDVADASSYRFLERQSDLRKVMEGEDLSLYENTAWRGDTYGLTRRGGVTSFGELLSDARSQEKANSALSPWPSPTTRSTLDGPGFVRSWPWWNNRQIPTAAVTGTSLSCGDGWRLGGHEPTCHLGALAAWTGARGETLWRPGAGPQIAGYALSLLATLALAMVVRR